MKTKILKLMIIVIIVFSLSATVSARGKGERRIIEHDLGNGRVVTITVEEDVDGFEDNLKTHQDTQPMMSPGCVSGICTDFKWLNQTCSNGVRLKYHSNVSGNTHYWINWQDNWWGGNPGSTGNTISCSSSCNITIDTNWSAYYTSASVQMAHWNFGIDSYACK